MNPVRVDTLTTGQRFRDVQGHVWRFDRKDHALSGAYWADREPPFDREPNRKRDCFAGCAVVTLLD